MTYARALVVAAASLLFSAQALAQVAEKDVVAQVTREEGAFWDTYNGCDVAAMAKRIADDIEFYHDIGGITAGRAAFSDIFKNNICSDPAHRIRRAARPDGVRVFPLQNDGKVYGALVSGEHVFYTTNKGAPEFASAQARFTHLWTLKGDAWKLTRAFSFDHQQPPYINKRTAVRLSPAALRVFAGRYKDKDKALYLVKAAGNKLLLTVDGKDFTLLPENANSFFVKTENLTATFAPGSIVIRENGGVVAEASKRP